MMANYLDEITRHAEVERRACEMRETVAGERLARQLVYETRPTRRVRRELGGMLIAAGEALAR